MTPTAQYQQCTAHNSAHRVADALQGTPTLSVPVVLVGNKGEEAQLVVDVNAKLNDVEEVVGVVIQEESDDGAFLDALMAGLGDVVPCRCRELRTVPTCSLFPFYSQATVSHVLVASIIVWIDG